MAKKIKVNKRYLRDADEVVYVNSHTYGKHTRAARGSKTPVTVNDVLASHAKKTGAINAAAKAVYDVLKLYSGNFREGQLWQHILSRMRKAKSMDPEDLFLSLDEMEINSRYALKRFGNEPMFTIENKKKQLQIEMKPFMPPHLNKNDDSYQYELIILLFNSKGACVHHEAEQTKWFKGKEKPDMQVFNFQKPANAKHYLLCLHLQGGKNGIATGTFGSRGMAVMTDYNKRISM